MVILENSKIGYRDILKQKEFMKTVIADIINRFGDSIDSIAFVWMVYQVTQSAAWSAIIFGVNKIPTVFLQPFAGAAVEGRIKKKIMVVTDIIRGICVGFIATALILGFVNQWILLTVTILISCAEAFRIPASAAILPKLLDKKYYEFGLSLSRSTSSVTELIGLGAAGIIISAFSVSAAIYIDMATFFISALILFTLNVTEGTLSKAGIHVKEYISTLKGGFSYLKQNKTLRYFVVFAVFLNGVLVPFNSLQAPMISEVLHTNEIMLSVLGISISVGMILGAAVYPYISGRIGKRMLTMLGGYSIGAFYFTFLIVGRYITSVILMYVIITVVTFLIGTAISLLTSFINVEFMKNVEEEYMARTVALFGAGMVAAMPVVSFLVSAVAGIASTAVLFTVAGVLDIIICLNLCSKKRFSSMQNKVPEEVIYEESAGDSQAG